MQLFCGFLNNTLTERETGLPLNRPNHDNKMMQWAGAVLLLTSTPGAQARKLALKLLPKTPKPTQVLKVCQDFFWDSTLSTMLLSGTTVTFNTSNDAVPESLPKE